jgi:uncharacterized protein YndB with AHSA1/START domain
MNKTIKIIEFRFERTIPAPPEKVYDAWLNPKVPGTPWHKGAKLIFNPELDGLFWVLVLEGSPHPHYGRFTELERPGRIQYTWISPNTLGEETIVTLTFKKKDENTLMTLEHFGLPDTDDGRAYEEGWNYFLNTFREQFWDAPKK